MPNEVIQPGSKLIFMKVGVHAQEDLASIIERKKRELEDAGRIFWGYGGPTCHPKLVQPFAKQAALEGHSIHLVMEEMNSRHNREPTHAKEYSSDGVNWEKVPKGVVVKGSRYAMVLESFEDTDDVLDLSLAQVAYGPSVGRSAANYVRGKVDKGCFEIVTKDLVPGSTAVIRQINAVARLASPYAVFLR